MPAGAVGCALSGDLDVCSRVRQVFTKAALIEFGNRRAFQFVALVEEGDAEGETDIAAENARILCPM